MTDPQQETPAKLTDLPFAPTGNPKVFVANGQDPIAIIDATDPVPKPKKKRLTAKQTIFIKEKAKGKNNTEAAMVAYDVKSADVARSIGAENLAKPSIREALDEALAKAGITIETAIEPIQDALAYESEDQRDQLDMRLKGSDRALKLLGATQAEKDPNGGSSFLFIGKNTFVNGGGNS